MFKVMTTDDGFCCVFNAVEQTDLLKTDTSTIAASKYFFNINFFSYNSLFNFCDVT